MKIAKKAIVILLALCTASSVMVGCAKKSSTTDTSASGGAKANLTVEVFDRGKPGQPPLNNNYWTKWINENFGKKYNATVEFVPIPRGQEVDKLNVLMSANQAPDICYTYDTSVVYNYYKQGGLTQLDSLVSKYGQTISKYLGKTILKYGTYDKKLMAIPAKRTYVANNGTFIRKDWLDKLGLPLPTTRDEFYNDLVAFRDKNPGGASNVVPYAYAIGSGVNIYTENLIDSFYKDINDDTTAKYLSVSVGGNPVVWKMPGYKDYMLFMNKLYHDNLLSKDFAIDKSGTQAYADLSNGKAGAVSANAEMVYRQTPGIETNLEKNVPNGRFVPVDCFKNTYLNKNIKSVYTPNGFSMMVPKTSKNAALAVKYLNWMSEFKVTLFLQNGVEGQDYTMVNGMPKAKTPSTFTGERMMPSVYNGDYDIVTNGMEVGNDAKNIEAAANAYPGYEKQVVECLTINQKDGFVPFYITTPNASAAKYSTNLLNKGRDMTAKLITCPSAQFSTLYDSLVADLMSTGGQAIVDENVKNYNAQTGKKIS
jgi:putative aldouronate transport system substrate-binding protein